MNTVYYTDAVTNADSSWVKDLYYDKDSKEFHLVTDSNSVYKYTGVHDADALAWMNANSLGEFYSDYVKGQWASNGLIGNAYGIRFEKRVPPTYTGLRDISRGVQTPAEIRDNYGVPVTPKAMNVVTTPSVQEESERKWNVSFTVAGSNDVRTYKVETNEISEAVAAVREVAEVLGVTVDVVGVNLVD